RNAVMSGQSLTAMPHSKVKVEIAKIFKEEGFIDAYDVVDGERPGQLVLRIRIKYVGERRDRQAVITNLQRVSRPGRRVYTKKQDIPWILSGLGVAIISTPKGIMTGQRARQMNLGGEYLCKIW
ncbi:MAG: 30S ribosomal protein S8, partial [Chloroflexota bacterium]